ncbi:MAG: tRNA (guanosine(37)-N1)-methyltransferase TrmD [Clostridia bacterium]|nr:tRNA (guanosine(37)-N1)-methyltransferase TrmD [Clostridia bacterium]
MRIDILTLFPEMFAPLQTSLLGKAQDKNALEINLINIRDFSKDKHKKCDDYTFGGGNGMLMTPQPIYDAITSIKGYKRAYKIYMSPKGITYNQEKAKTLSQKKHIIILCGHYEGIDERIIDLLIDEEISIGDYVLTGGEIPAMAVVDSLSRYIDGVLGDINSTEDESFSNGLLEYPQYTRPQEFMGLKVPDVLVSGDHQKVDQWRKEQSIKITKKRRPELIGEGK